MNLLSKMNARSYLVICNQIIYTCSYLYLRNIRLMDFCCRLWQFFPFSPFTIANLDSQITFFDLFWSNFRRLGVCVIGFPSNPNGGQRRSESGMDTAFMAGLVDVAGQGLKKVPAIYNFRRAI